MSKKNILIGFYKGIGDFVNMIPILKELDKNYNINILITRPIIPFIDNIDLPGNTINFILFDTVSSGKFISQIKLLYKLSGIKFEYFFISPDPQIKNTSLLIPFFIKVLKCLKFKHRFTVVGSELDRLSRLYDIQLPISKSIPLLNRNLLMFTLMYFLPIDFRPNLQIFKKTKVISENYDIIIHPGASSENRKLPFRNLEMVIDDLKAHNFKVAFIGLNSDLEQYSILKSKVDFINGPLDYLLSIINSSKLIITMDSGFSHIASLMGIVHIAIMGPGDIKATPPSGFNSHIIITNHPLSCMPCNSSFCKYNINYCLSTISSSEILDSIYSVLGK